MKNRKRTIIAIIILILSVTACVASVYYKVNYKEQTFDTIIYHILRGPEKANTEVVGIALKVCILPIILLVTLFSIPLTNFKKEIKIRKFKIYPIEKVLNYKIRYAVIILILSIIFALGEIGLYTYLVNQFNRSEIFENEYVASENVKITFPEEKRNLIYIFLESMEATVASKENGGGWEYSIIPELETLAKENINFSNTDTLGGARPLPGTGWTVAGMVAHTSGVPLKISLPDHNDYKGYSSFLPGVYSMGDILKKEGYNLKLMVGSDAEFGGRKDYFTIHGDYEIFDYNTAIEEGKMTKDDKVWWGYSDDDLFKWAKDEIIEMAEQDAPFNFIMLTADTHFTDGYLSKKAEEKFDTQYENVFAYSSKSVYEFIEWMKKQDFYKNTTIVVVGDHIGMQTEFYEKHLEKDYTRTIYNTFINSAIPEANSKNRQFSTLDIFPTVLASIGAEIEGERLGLGTNLFSGEQTLIEKYGYKKIEEELNRRSNFYNKKLLGDSYIEMLTSSAENKIENTITE